MVSDELFKQHRDTLVRLRLVSSHVLGQEMRKDAILIPAVKILQRNLEFLDCQSGNQD